jgi:hypothetical protein
MCAAIYARVSTTRQARTQKADQQIERLKAYAKQKDWTLEEDQLYLDEGYSGASLSRPGLDALRDAAAMTGSRRFSSPRRTDWRATTSTRSCSSKSSKVAAVG